MAERRQEISTIISDIAVPVNSDFTNQVMGDNLIGE